MGDALPFTNLGADRRASQIMPAGGWTCALLEEGQLRCWGWNLEGELGLGDIVFRGSDSSGLGDNLPLVDLGTGVRAEEVVARWAQTCAVLEDDRIKCWGDNPEGELGLGETGNRGDAPGEMGDALPFVDLGADFAVAQLVMGRTHACALSKTGQVKCWGTNRYGQLGLGDRRSRGSSASHMGDALPTVALGEKVMQLAAGYEHTCALLEGGDIRCWGRNNHGQLGLGASGDRGDEPGEMGSALPLVDLGKDNRARLLASGGHHVCVVLTNGQVKCWGNNDYGQLGLGDRRRRGDGAGEMGDALPQVVLW